MTTPTHKFTVLVVCDYARPDDSNLQLAFCHFDGDTNDPPYQVIVWDRQSERYEHRDSAQSESEGRAKFCKRMITLLQGVEAGSVFDLVYARSFEFEADAWREKVSTFKRSLKIGDQI